MMRDIEAHPEEYAAKHLEKLREFLKYANKDLREYLSYSDLMGYRSRKERRCSKRHKALIFCISWLIVHIERRFPGTVR